MRRSSRLGMVLCLLAAVYLALASADPASAQAAQQAQPRLELLDDTFWLSRLPPILDDKEVRDHLATGLTTTLALRLEARGETGKLKGGAVVTVRFDLWDEVFHVAYAGATGSPQRMPFESYEDLETWWRDLRLAVLPASSRTSRRLSQPRLVIDVVPFSAAEARETQRWFSDTLSDAKTSSAEGASSDESSDTLSRTFRLMMATSIQRRALQVYRYEPVIETRPAGAPP